MTLNEVRELVTQLTFEEKLQLRQELTQQIEAASSSTIIEKLVEMGLIAPKPTAPATPPLTPAEAKALAARVGALGSVSELIIQERRAGR